MTYGVFRIWVGLAALNLEVEIKARRSRLSAQIRPIDYCDILHHP
jgi:hypothetical protein